MTEEIEIKVRRDGQRWQDSPPVCSVKVTAPERDLLLMIANRAASAVADFYKQEARWNYEGSMQGHYVGTTW